MDWRAVSKRRCEGLLEPGSLHNPHPGHQVPPSSLGAVSENGACGCSLGLQFCYPQIWQSYCWRMHQSYVGPLEKACALQASNTYYPAHVS